MYVFDTNSFITLGHFFPERFLSFWKSFNLYVSEEKILSVREVYKELDREETRPHLFQWIKDNRNIFKKPTGKETEIVAQIFQIPKFQHLIGQRQRLKGSPVADPWLIASAKIQNGCVISEEKAKPNAVKIPNVCQHFDVDCCNLETFMKREGWEF